MPATANPRPVPTAAPAAVARVPAEEAAAGGEPRIAFGGHGLSIGLRSEAGNPFAGVAYFKSHGFVVQSSDSQRHPAVIGELHGVPQEVDQNLAQFTFVALHGSANLLDPFHAQSDLLVVARTLEKRGEAEQRSIRSREVSRSLENSLSVSHLRSARRLAALKPTTRGLATGTAF